MTLTGLEFEIFRRLAELNLYKLDDDSCVYLAKQVLDNMMIRERISGHERCRVRWYSANGEENQPWVEVAVLSNRGFMKNEFCFRKSWLRSEMVPVVEVMGL